MLIPLYVTLYFVLVAFRILSSFAILIMLCLSVGLFGPSYLGLSVLTVPLFSLCSFIFSRVQLAFVLLMFSVFIW